MKKVGYILFLIWMATYIGCRSSSNSFKSDGDRMVYPQWVYWFGAEELYNQALWYSYIGEFSIIRKAEVLLYNTAKNQEAAQTERWNFLPKISCTKLLNVYPYTKDSVGHITTYLCLKSQGTDICSYRYTGGVFECRFDSLGRIEKEYEDNIHLVRLAIEGAYKCVWCIDPWFRGEMIRRGYMDVGETQKTNWYPLWAYWSHTEHLCDTARWLAFERLRISGFEMRECKYVSSCSDLKINAKYEKNEWGGVNIGFFSEVGSRTKHLRPCMLSKDFKTEYFEYQFDSLGVLKREYHNFRQVERPEWWYYTEDKKPMRPNMYGYLDCMPTWVIEEAIRRDYLITPAEHPIQYYLGDIIWW